MLVFVFVALFAWGAAGASVSDDFSAYAEGSLAMPVWQPHSLDYRVRSGRYAYSPAASDSRVVAAHAAAKLATDTTVSAAFRVAQRRAQKNTSWPVFGVALYRDSSNFWAAQIVENPASFEHFFEVEQLKNGQWSTAHTDAQAVVWNIRERWQYNTDYRVTLSMDPSSGGARGMVSATWVHLGNGSLVAQIVWNVTAEDAVSVGRGALTVACFDGSFDDVTTSWTTESSSGGSVYPAYVAPSACNGGPKGLGATGFFRTAQVNGKWWLVDPLGNAHWMVGIDHVSWWGHWCEALDRYLYHENVTKKYGDDEATWAAAQIERLKAWGFNTLATGHSESLRHRGLPHTVWHSTGSFSKAYDFISPITTWTGFPDVFSDVWPDFLAVMFTDSDGYKDDPWVIGHFVDNELEWWGSPPWSCFEDWGMFRQVSTLNATSPAKQRWVTFLEAEIPSNFASVFYTNFNVSGVSSAQALLNSIDPIQPVTAEGEAIALRFLRLVADKYFSTVSSALKEADPNHLYFCNRFPGFAPSIQDIADAYCDVVTYNYYPTIEPLFGIPPNVPKQLESWHAASPSRPMIITEWSFPALDAGLPCDHGAGMRIDTQDQRRRSFTFFQNLLFSMPFIVGSDYFMMIDEPALGISSTFPEDSNYGLVDVNDEPWPLVENCAGLNPQACPIHAAGLSDPPIHWGHQDYLESDGTVVASYDSPARGLTVGIDGKYIALSFNGETLCRFTPTVGADAPGYTNELWAGMGSVEETLVQVVDDKVVSRDYLFSCSWNVNITLRVTLATSSESSTPWASVKFLRIINGLSFTENITLHHTALEILSEIGADGATNDNTGSATPYTNFWQRGLAFRDDNEKEGFGVWGMGMYLNFWTSWGPLKGVFVQDVSSLQKLLPRGETWISGTAENISHVFFFPYTYSVVGEDWQAMDDARNAVQGEVVVPTALPGFADPTESTSNSGASGGNGGNDDNASDASAVFLSAAMAMVMATAAATVVVA